MKARDNYTFEKCTKLYGAMEKSIKSAEQDYDDETKSAKKYFNTQIEAAKKAFEQEKKNATSTYKYETKDADELLKELKQNATDTFDSDLNEYIESYLANGGIDGYYGYYD